MRVVPAVEGCCCHRPGHCGKKHEGECGCPCHDEDSFVMVIPYKHDPDILHFEDGTSVPRFNLRYHDPRA
jgi:hypothetical protein